MSRITLKRLSVAEVAEILHGLAGQEPPERLVQLVFGETEGVPFFVEEVYRHLAEERRLTDAAGKWLPQVEIGEIEVPETVRLVLGAPHRPDRRDRAAHPDHCRLHRSDVHVRLPDGGVRGERRKTCSTRWKRPSAPA